MSTGVTWWHVPVWLIQFQALSVGLVLSPIPPPYSHKVPSVYMFSPILLRSSYAVQVITVSFLCVVQKIYFQYFFMSAWDILWVYLCCMALGHGGLSDLSQMHSPLVEKLTLITVK